MRNVCGERCGENQYTHFMLSNFFLGNRAVGYAVAQLVEALRYKPEGRGFDSRWSHWNFSVT